MKVLICYKWERDSDEATISNDGSLKWFNTKLKPTDDEAAAIACAKKIAADTEGTLTAVTIGDGDATWALARGASRTVSVAAYSPDKDDVVTASQLANAIQAAGDYDVILMGDAREFSGVVPVTAAILGIPVVAGVTDVAVDPDDPTCLIAHRTTTQAQETIKIHGPAMISVAATAKEKTPPTMRQIMAAKKLPVDKLDAAELGQVVNSGVTVKDSRLPAKRVAQLFEGEASQTVSELLVTLRAREVL